MKKTRDGSLLREPALGDNELVTQLMNISLAENDRDEPAVESIDEVPLSPLICKSPQPLALEFECSSENLSSEEKSGNKRAQEFTPKQKPKKIKNTTLNQ